MNQRNQKESLPAYEFPVYSETELEQFDQEIQPYWYEKEIKFPKPDKIRLVDWERFHCDNGSKTKDGAIILAGMKKNKNRQGDWHWSYDYPSRYAFLENKISQWREWRGKKEFIEQRKVEGLEELAEKVTMDTKFNF